MIKNMEKGVKGNIQTLSKTLFSVGKEVTVPAEEFTNIKEVNQLLVQEKSRIKKTESSS